MKKISMALFTFCLLTALSGAAFAWGVNGHKNSVIRAFEFMQGAQSDANQQWIISYVRYIGGATIDQRLAQKNNDTDNYYDTSIGGWWIGYRTNADLLGYSVNFTSYWHFVTMFMPGHFGNQYDGYSYQYSPEDGFWGYNGLAKSALYNQDTKNKGTAGSPISYPENGAGVRDAYRFKYQLSSTLKYYATTSGGNYEDYQNTIFEPSANAGAYWYGKALSGRTSQNADLAHLDYMGHVMHFLGDANVAQHVWDTLDHNHSAYEEWVDANSPALYDAARVAAIIAEFRTAFGLQTDEGLKNIPLQKIIKFFAAKTVNAPAPLYSEDVAVRQANGAEAFNRSVAANILILEKYVYDLYAAPEKRIF